MRRIILAAALTIAATLGITTLPAHASPAAPPRHPVITLAHRPVHLGGWLSVTVRLPVTVRNPEVDADTAASTADSPGPAVWAVHHGTVRAGHPFTVILRFPVHDRADLGRWQVLAVYAGSRMWVISGVPFTVTR